MGAQPPAGDGRNGSDVSTVDSTPGIDTRRRSRHVVEGPERAAARSYLYSIGLTDEDLQRPIVGVANTWIGTMPCNFHLRRLSEQVMEGIRAAGGTPLEYNTIAISDGI